MIKAPKFCQPRGKFHNRKEKQDLIDPGRARSSCLVQFDRESSTPSSTRSPGRPSALDAVSRAARPIQFGTAGLRAKLNRWKNLSLLGEAKGAPQNDTDDPLVNNAVSSPCQNPLGPSGWPGNAPDKSLNP